MFGFLATLQGKIIAGLAGFALIVGAATGIYWKGRLDGRNLAEVSRLEANVRALQTRLRQAQESASADAARHKQDKQALDTLDAKVKELTRDLEDAGRECLSPSDVERLRDLWK